MSQFDPRKYQHTWEEQGCIERVITIFFYILGIAVLLGVGYFVLSSMGAF